MNTCPFCKGTVEEKNIEHIHRWGDELYLFEDVRAEVCKQCGEAFLFPETLKAIDTIVREKPKAERTKCIPVISMAGNAAA